MSILNKHPYFPFDNSLFKGVTDVVNLNPKKQLETVKEGVGNLKSSPLQGLTQIGMPIVGEGASPAAINQFIESKGKQRWEPGQKLDSSFVARYEQPDVIKSLPEVPVPDAPVSRSSGSVKSARAGSRAMASKRKGFLGTLFARETGGYRGGKTLGGGGGDIAGGGSSLLGG